MEADLDDVIGYPTSGDDAVRRFLLGAGIPSLLSVVWLVGSLVLFVLSVVVPVGFILFPLVLLFSLGIGFVVAVFWGGYFVRVVRGTLAEDPEPPAFDRWGPLLKDGLATAGIGLVYAIPYVAVMVGGTAVVAFLLGEISSISRSPDMGAILTAGSLLVFLLLFLLSLVLWAVIWYFIPISICAYAETGRFLGAFAGERIVAMATSADYALPWVGVAGAGFAIYLFVSVLTQFFVGYLLYPFIPFAYFWLGLAGFYAFAQAYGTAVDGVDLGA